ncbi:MAG: amidohydrolase [Candidatus Hydrogenedentota bacterium]
MARLFFVALLTLGLNCSSAIAQFEASFVLLNGKIYTGNEKGDVVKAIHIHKGKIAAVGSNEAMLGRVKPGTRVVELQGRTVLPGFIDSHGHLLNLGLSLMNLDLVGTSIYEEIVGRVAEAVENRKPGEWIIGRGWDQNDWAEKAFPSHGALSAISPNNPVLLTRIDGHASLVNAEAMRRAGLTIDTADPDGGRIMRDSEGVPTGVLIDRASGLVSTKVPAPDSQTKKRAIRMAIDHCTAKGLTSIHDAGVTRETVDLYKEAIDSNRFNFRVYAMLRAQKFDDFESFTTFLNQKPLIGYGNDQLTVRSVKVVADGALGSRGAALFDAYTDEPGNKGLLITDLAQLTLISNIALSKGYQVNAHAIGDLANNAVLTAYATAFKRKNGSKYRFRIEHAQIMRPEDIEWMGKLGVIASIQATHATSDMPWVEERVGAERIQGAYAWRTMIDDDVRIANGSDFPVENANPLWGFYAAITRADHEGNPAGGWRADQALTREEALHSFTLGGAYAAFEEDIKGSLEAGKWADLVILSKDIMTIPAAEILEIEVLLTLIGGKVVHRTEPF